MQGGKVKEGSEEMRMLECWCERMFTDFSSEEERGGSSHPPERARQQTGSSCSPPPLPPAHLPSQILPNLLMVRHLPDLTDVSVTLGHYALHGAAEERDHGDLGGEGGVGGEDGGAERAEEAEFGLGGGGFERFFRLRFFRFFRFFLGRGRADDSSERVLPDGLLSEVPLGVLPGRGQDGEVSVGVGGC